jgi:hypothetical protein
VTRAALIAALLLTACSSSHKEPEVSGIGKYKFTTTKLKNVHEGQCQATELDDGRKGTWCFQLPGFKVGKSSIAEMDLYFLGTDPEASLIEILLKVRGCDETELDQWMRTALGPPIETKSTREYWKTKYLWAAALMPSEPARCVVHLLPLSENSEIDRIKQL